MVWYVHQLAWDAIGKCVTEELSAFLQKQSEKRVAAEYKISNCVSAYAFKISQLLVETVECRAFLFRFLYSSAIWIEQHFHLNI